MTLLWAQERDLRRNNLSKPQSQTSSLQNCEGVSHSVWSNSLRPHGLKPAGLFISWYSPGKNTEVGSHSLLHGIFPSDPGIERWSPALQADSLQFEPLGKPIWPLCTLNSLNPQTVDNLICLTHPSQLHFTSSTLKFRNYRPYQWAPATSSLYTGTAAWLIHCSQTFPQGQFHSAFLCWLPVPYYVLTGCIIVVNKNRPDSLVWFLRLAMIWLHLLFQPYLPYYLPHTYPQLFTISWIPHS